ncbi:similar to Saccharomyces cerevisiae YPL204W HRR25 Protein kinase involved in regulating diverse events including vesicular trafficking, DNA repair, and chromosome segregation [Maudiozyma barnettii]|uniref:non-specific serine/threonine protein kinase n=1 Tax=Maudiozyma barnettii TaxID=61262 RepID=A0A8H2VF19_9SACH|nr:uncharacterized protein KABA2_04S02882 [Kazachstania barnettii]CAB4254290.1 similar to Saccharomyces cerevisiae YPL204W HRR25 Protein kinase involved in regulating diverse events including vesicular trafficking, DNA repair, and chromosome segregation [Kazachstania barnettii]CAD1782091.1 similar to Saccharomyces cerevisiae YPL204W HRR25 Protein kinase involved in regulating diverse events including vesicular trafficking, DNA repair, and chromosome segregation [Kazachstania barnettii]
MDLRVGRKFRIGRKIGSGSFGDIYHGTNLISGEEVAVKLESIRSRHPQLDYESRVYKYLSGGVGIPFIRWFGREGEYNALVIDLLGPSLEDLFNYCHRQFSYKTVIMLALQMICRIQYMHGRSFIHRDIKPDNFLMGTGRRGSTVHAIDFGLSKKYRDFNTHRHIPYRENKSLTGTARYASLNTHLGIEQSRRDDLESLGYMLIYFCKSSLPWQGLKATTKKQKYDRILEKKLCISIDTLCQGLPIEFAQYMSYCRNLVFDEKPDYLYLARLFKDLSIKLDYHNDHLFDWTMLRYTKAMFEKQKDLLKDSGAGVDVSGIDKDGSGPNSKSFKTEQFNKIKTLAMKKFAAHFHYYVSDDIHNPTVEDIKKQSVENSLAMVNMPPDLLKAIDNGMEHLKNKQKAPEQDTVEQPLLQTQQQEQLAFTTPMPQANNHQFTKGKSYYPQQQYQQPLQANPVTVTATVMGNHSGNDNIRTSSNNINNSNNNQSQSKPSGSHNIWL